MPCLLCSQINKLQVEMSNALNVLLNLERKINIVREVNKFAVHTSVASCMYDRRLLEDEIWMATHSVPSPLVI